MHDSWHGTYVDLQIIVDIKACARYMPKYAAKGEPRSRAVQSIFKTCTDSLHVDRDARKALCSAILRSVGERDFSSQETTHMLLSLPLVSCAYGFAALSLDDSQQLSRDQRCGELLLQPSTVVQYAARDGLPDTSPCQFVAPQYTVCHGKLSKRSSPSLCEYSQSTLRTHKEITTADCKYQLLKYKP